MWRLLFLCWLCFLCFEPPTVLPAAGTGAGGADGTGLDVGAGGAAGAAGAAGAVGAVPRNLRASWRALSLAFLNVLVTAVVNVFKKLDII